MDIVEEMRGFEIDHDPEGWPGVQMRQVSALCDEIERLRAELAHVGAADEVMEKDAERYRWLSGMMFRNETGHLDIGGEISCNWHDPNKSEIDHAIDAAMVQTHNA